MMYIKDFFNDESGIETLEMISFIGIGAALLGVIIAIYVNIKSTADKAKDTVGNTMTEIDNYVSQNKDKALERFIIYKI